MLCPLLVEEVAEGFVEVGGDGLGGVEEVVFGFGFGLGLGSGDAATVGKDLVVVEGEKLVDAGGKLLHIEYVAPLYLRFDIVEVGCDGAFEGTWKRFCTMA